MKLLAWVDGGSRGNPGPAGYGVLICGADARPRLHLWGFIDKTTNNVAEYRGMIAALDAALELGAAELEVRTDSELMQREIAGIYKVRQPHLQDLMAEVRGRAAKLSSFVVHHVRREQNRVADMLANRAMDRRASGREAPEER